MDIEFVNPGVDYMIQRIMDFQTEAESAFWSEPLYRFYPQLDKAYAISLPFSERNEYIERTMRAVYAKLETSVYKGYKQDKIEMRGDRAEMSDFPLYLNTVAGGLDRRDQTIGGFSFVVKIYAVPVVEIIG